MPRTAALLLTLVALSPWASCVAQVFGTVTILEGEALVLRGPGRVHATEGLRVQATDIIEMGGKGFAQIEFGDKSRLLLGPNARALFNASSARHKPEHSLYALSGWFKLIGSGREPQANVPGLELRSPRFDIPPAAADVVVRINADEVDVFSERGATRLIERSGQAVSQPIDIKAGQHYSRKGNEKATIRTGPQQTFVADLPRAFRDSLPARASLFAGKEIVAKSAPDFGYGDVEPWLKADPNVRRPLVARWRHKSRDPAFRAALIANMAAHLEWDRILFPEKYLPKPPPPSTPAAAFERPGRAPSNQY